VTWTVEVCVGIWSAVLPKDQIPQVQDSAPLL
jgi:hypothetical protein